MKKLSFIISSVILFCYLNHFLYFVAGILQKHKADWKNTHKNTRKNICKNALIFAIHHVKSALKSDIKDA